MEQNRDFARRNLIWSFEETKMHNDREVYCRGSTRSTTRHPCSRTLKSSTTGSKIESLLSCISRWIGVRDDDRWMQVEISAFFSLSVFSFVIFLYGKIFMGWHWSRWLVSLVEGCLSGFLFLFCVLVYNEERKCYEIRYDLLILTWKNLKIEFFFLNKISYIFSLLI